MKKLGALSDGVCDGRDCRIAVWRLRREYKHVQVDQHSPKGAGEEFQAGVLVVLVNRFEDVMIACMRAAFSVSKSFYCGRQGIGGDQSGTMVGLAYSPQR